MNSVPRSLRIFWAFMQSAHRPDFWRAASSAFCMAGAYDSPPAEDSGGAGYAGFGAWCAAVGAGFRVAVGAGLISLGWLRIAFAGGEE